MSLIESTDNIVLLRNTAKTIHELAQRLYSESNDFPAVNRNAKRVLASIELIQINLEEFDQ
jgi:hypothetical protein